MISSRRANRIRVASGGHRDRDDRARRASPPPRPAGRPTAAPALAPTVDARESQVNASITVPPGDQAAWARLLRTVICGAMQRPGERREDEHLGDRGGEDQRQVGERSSARRAGRRRARGGRRCSGAAPKAMPPSAEPEASAAVSGPPSAAAPWWAPKAGRLTSSAPKEAPSGSPARTRTREGRRAQRAEPVALGVGVAARLDREQALEEDRAGGAEHRGDQQADGGTGGRRQDARQERAADEDHLDHDRVERVGGLQLGRVDQLATSAGAGRRRPGACRSRRAPRRPPAAPSRRPPCRARRRRPGRRR